MDYKSPFDPLSQMSDINMTPLIDLSFLLLITFIITFPLIKMGIPLNLPKGEGAELQGQKSRMVSIDIKGGIYLDEQPISPGQLTVEMNALGKANPDITVYVRADEGIEYGEVVNILEIMHKAKISKMALVTQPEDKDRRP